MAGVSFSSHIPPFLAAMHRSTKSIGMAMACPLSQRRREQSARTGPNFECIYVSRRRGLVARAENLEACRIAMSKFSAVMSDGKRVPPFSSSILQQKSGMARTFVPVRWEHPYHSAAGAL